jgi:hypothetical protein
LMQDVIPEISEGGILEHENSANLPQGLTQ